MLNCSDPLDNSHTTQLLQHALAPALQNQEPSNNPNLAPPNDDGINSVHDFSLDSRIFPARSVTPRYHLPVSAWQNPQATSVNGSGDCVLAEDSQKENCQENGELGPSAPSPASPYNVSLQGSRSEPFHLHGDTPFSAAAGKVIGTRSASFLPPSTTPGAHPFPRPTSSMPVRNRQYRRSLSLDSFGGPVTQDPAEQYLASAKPFQVPLADLGETPTQEVIHSPADPGETLPDASEYNELIEAVVREFEEQKANGVPSIPSRILVAATPSNSGESSAASQHDDFLLHNRGREQQSTFEFNGSSSFDKMLDRDLCDAPDPTPEPARLQETRPVQADGLADVDPPTRDDILTIPQLTDAPFEWIAPAPGATVASSNPRSLFSLVHPNNKYRIAKMRALAGDVGPNLRISGTETQPSHIEETQPCHDDEPTFSNVLPLAQPPPRIYIPGSRSTRHQPDEEDEDGGPGDALDIVPDSEPLRAGSSAQSRSHHRAVTRSPLKKPFSPLSPMSENGSGDIVPDSLGVEEGEADIPLVIEASRGAKRSEVPTENKTVHNRNTKAVTSAVPAKPSSSSTTEKNSRAKPSKMEYTEVPTSLPEQDLQCQTFSSKPLLAATTETLFSNKKGRGSRSGPRARSTSATRPPATKPTAGNKRSRQSDTESSDDSSRQLAMPLRVLKEEEEETASADDCDVESPPPPSPPLKSDTSRKKRRRTEDVNPSRGTSKATSSTRNKRSETPAVVTRSARRLRSGVSSVRGLAAEAATRVFALWKQDGHYYSGAVYSLGQKNKYTIKFDDMTNDEVEVKNLRRRELVVGDRVIIIEDNVKAVVRDISQADSRGAFTLDIDDGEVVSTREAQFPDIRIANRTIQSQWKERMVAAENIVTVVKPKPLIDATPSRQSVASMTPGKVQRELVKTGFVVTISPKNTTSPRTKDDAMRAIKQRGGLVIEDWSSVFTMEGKHSQSNRRWIATPQDFRWKPDVNLDRVFLLSDDAHQKPKFLLALALGIPCLSFDWLSKEGELSSDWQPHLLPAGYSDSLCARLSQIVDLDWGNCTEHLTDIMANQVPMKLFSGKTVLCIGTELVPLPPNRANKNASDEASRYVPWIILCMGANKVEAVTDTKQVSASYIQTFDYAVVKERGHLGNVKLGERPVVRDVEWVKQCLVSSRLSDPE